MNDSPYGPPPAAPQQPQAFTSPQAQHALPPQPQYGQPQYGQPQYAPFDQAPPAPLPYGAPPSGRRGVGMMIAGPVIFLVGVLITVVTYVLAPPGGAYIISFGPMIFGIVWFIRGLITYSRSR